MNRSARRDKVGFSLVEVVLAVGITSFCLLAIFGLLPVALTSNQAAIEQTAANAILTSVVADLRATPLGKTASEHYKIAIASGAAPPKYLFLDGEHRIVQETSARYRLSIEFVTGQNPTPSATMANLKVTWPAGANPSSPAGAVQTFVALDRM